MQFERAYYDELGYCQREKLVKRNFLEVINWASQLSGLGLLFGKGKRALDVGCAYGYACEILESIGYETYGIDVSKWGARKAKGNSNGQFLICDAETEFPFKTETFDLITCFDVLEHLNYPVEVLQNMFELCRGVMVCTTPNIYVEKPARKTLRDFDKTHINVKSPREWQTILKKKLDYTFLKVETFCDLNLKFGAISFFRSFRLPNLGLTTRIIAKK